MIGDTGLNIRRREKTSGRNLYNLIGDIICFVIGLGLIIPGIIVLTNGTIISGSVLVVVGIITFALPIGEFLWTRKTKKDYLKSAESEEPFTRENSSEDYILSEEEKDRIDNWWKSSISEIKRPYKSSVKVIKFNQQQEQQIDLMEFSGDYGTKICLICKLGFKKDQRILECPICLSLFHSKHLKPWLKSTQKCPVCGQQILHQ